MARRGGGTIGLLAALALGCSGGTTGGDPAGFEEFDWQAGAPDVRTERLCPVAEAPDRAPVEEVFIDCALEGARFAPATRPPDGDGLAVVAWNVLRGFEADRQIELLRSGAFGPIPDVILLSEADRGCARSGFRNVARDFAEAFGYHYVFATEFLELFGPRGPSGPYEPPLCEHGNAIVSRYPLGNVREIRHAANRSWYAPPDFPDPDEPRLGGRVAVRADANVNGRLVRFYVVHFESTLETLAVRDAQAEEVAEDGLDAERVIVGGDLNAYAALSDLRTGNRNDAPTQAFLSRGYVDAHADLDPDDRVTSYDTGLVIDFLFSRGVEGTSAGTCGADVCGDLSDHAPVWATFRLPRAALPH